MDPGEGPPGGGRPTLIFYQTKTRRAEKLFLRPPPPRLSVGLDPPLDIHFNGLPHWNAQKMLAIVGITPGVRDGSYYNDNENWIFLIFFLVWTKFLLWRLNILS